MFRSWIYNNDTLKYEVSAALSKNVRNINAPPDALKTSKLLSLNGVSVDLLLFTLVALNTFVLIAILHISYYL